MEESQLADSGLRFRARFPAHVCDSSSGAFDTMNDRLDILFLIRSMGRGGAERQLSLLARALHAQGIRVAVAVFYAGDVLDHELRAAGVEVVDLQKLGRWSNLGVLRKFRSIVRRRRPRVLHTYMATQNVLALLLRPWLRRQDCAVVCGVRTSLPNAWRYDKVAGMVDCAQKLLLRFADRIISNSSAALHNLGVHVLDGRAVVVPNGIEQHRFGFSSELRSVQRSAWNAPDDSVLLGLVGRLDPQKNHALLIEALHLAGDEVPQVSLVFVGDGSFKCKQELQAYAESNGVASRILWAGASSDMASIYSALDVLCLCSDVEGFPNVLAEAMSAGLPCVTTDVGDAALIVGDCGWIVPPGDAPALSRALLQAVRALPGWERERPRRRVLEEFSVDALSNRTLKALAPFLGEAA